MSDSRIFKLKRAADFVMLPNAVAQNPGLSMRAKGLLLLLMSFPDDWKIYKDTLHKYSSDGRDATRTAFDELQRAGYITAVQLREGNKYSGIDYYVSVHPDEKPTIQQDYTDAGTQRPEVQRPEVQRAENPTLQINTIQKNSNKQTLTNASEIEICPTFDEFWEAGLPKADKERAQRLWNKITQAEREKIMQYIPVYVDATGEKRFMKSAATFLNQKAWNNEIIDRKSATAIVNSITTAAETESRIRSYFD